MTAHQGSNSSKRTKEGAPDVQVPGTCDSLDCGRARLGQKRSDLFAQVAARVHNARQGEEDDWDEEWSVYIAVFEEAARAPGKTGLAETVARYLFKLMAYKDEYEVARLYTDGSFLKQVENEFGGDKLRFEFHLAPPLLARRDKATGLPRKMSFGPWLLPVFRLLAKLKPLRGTPLDPFGRSPERRTERRLIADYEAMLDEILAKLTPDNHHLAVGLAVIPEKIRGFGHVKQRHLVAAKADEAALLEQFRSGSPALLKAAE